MGGLLHILQRYFDTHHWFLLNLNINFFNLYINNLLLFELLLTIKTRRFVIFHLIYWLLYNILYCFLCLFHFFEFLHWLIQLFIRSGNWFNLNHLSDNARIGSVINYQNVTESELVPLHLIRLEIVAATASEGQSVINLDVFIEVLHYFLESVSKSALVLLQEQSCEGITKIAFNERDVLIKVQ